MSKQFYFEKLIEKEKNSLSLSHVDKENLEKSFDLFSSNISSEDFFLEDYELLSKILIQCHKLSFEY